MENIKGTKQRMTQVFQEDVAFGATPIQFSEAGVAESFAIGDMLTISGVTKGHGFQGVVKRHGFHGGPKSHGQKDRLRAPGSIGATAPQRVFPGKKMAGRMGGAKRTIKNISVVAIDAEANTIYINGSVPGYARTVVYIKKNDA